MGTTGEAVPIFRLMLLYNSHPYARGFPVGYGRLTGRFFTKVRI